MWVVATLQYRYPCFLIWNELDSKTYLKGDRRLAGAVGLVKRFAASVLLGIIQPVYWLILLFLLPSCLHIEPVYTTELGSEVLEFGDTPPYFYSSIDPYTADLIKSIGLPVELDHLEIVIDPSLPNLGEFHPHWRIYLFPQRTILSAYGHELVRVIAIQNGENWNQNSYDWSGILGEWWTLAEDLSLPYLP